MASDYFRGFRPGKSRPSRERGGGIPGVFGAIFLPAEAAGGCKPVASPYFRGRGAYTQ